METQSNKNKAFTASFKEEKILKLANGLPFMFVGLSGLMISIFLLIFSISVENEIYAVLSVVLSIGAIILLAGINIVKPNEAMVFTFLGEYKGVLKHNGIFFRNPFWTAQQFKMNKSSLAFEASKPTTNQEQVNLHLVPSKKISLKMMSLNNKKQKVNDALGNPIMVGSIVIWHIVNPTQTVFNVENPIQFLSDQCDSAIRDIARLYPYDLLDETEDELQNEKTLRGSAKEIAEKMAQHLQEKVSFAGICIDEVRITDLSYSEEIAASMLQRQQATAIIAARKKIVDGAVGMVEMALKELEKNDTVVLDDERKAMMVSNLLVVLCGNKEAQPVVNSGSLY